MTATAPPRSAPPIGPQSRVRLREVVVRHEGGRLIVGNETLGRFFAVDEDAARVVELLREDRSIEDVEMQILIERGHTYDVAEAVAFLSEQGLVASVDGKPVPLAPALEERLARASGVAPPSRALSTFAGWPLAALTAASAAVVVFLFLTRPHYVPNPGSVLLATPSPLLTLVVSTLASVLVVSFHEAGHWATARAFGVRSRISLSARLYFLVLQTDVTNAWKLPKAERAIIFLGGMSANVVAMAAITLALAARDAGLWEAPLLGTFAPLLLFFNLFQMLFQFFVFLRTDLYFLFVTVTGEWNLHQDVARYLSGRAASAVRGARRALTGSARTGEDLAREAGLAHAPASFGWYAAVLVLGTGGALALMLFSLRRMLGTFGPLVGARAREGFAAGDWFALAEAAGIVLYFGLFVYLIADLYLIRAAKRLLAWWREAAAT